MLFVGLFFQMLGDNKSEVFSFAAVDESDVDEAFIDVGVVSEDLD